VKHGTSRHAFTLIELMIVVAIIGILASIAVPNFVKFSCRAKQTEAKTGLKVLMVAQDSYRAVNDTYIGDPSASTMLDRMLNGKQRYDYSIVLHTPASYTAQALPKPGTIYVVELNNDTWLMNESGILNNTTPGCQ
jgi:prepilin-type N-terminal cleavage/methylation domain-containing protein